MLVSNKHLQYLRSHKVLNYCLYCTTLWCANMYFMPVTQHQAALLLIWGVALRDVTNNSCVRDYFDLCTLFCLRCRLFSFSSPRLYVLQKPLLVSVNLKKKI